MQVGLNEHVKGGGTHVLTEYAKGNGAEGVYPLRAPPGWTCSLKLTRVYEDSLGFRQYANVECAKGESKVSTIASAAMSQGSVTDESAEMTLEANGTNITYSLMSCSGPRRDSRCYPQMQAAAVRDQVLK